MSGVKFKCPVCEQEHRMNSQMGREHYLASVGVKSIEQTKVDTRDARRDDGKHDRRPREGDGQK